MINLLRTNIHHPKFKALVQELDSELGDMYGDDMAFFAPHNILKDDTFALVALQNDEPVGIGAFFIIGNNAEVEIKRMYVPPTHRGKGISKLVLQELENWARDKKIPYAKLETGDKNVTAISLYKKAGYLRIDLYEPYLERADSLCFGKKL